MTFTPPEGYTSETRTEDAGKTCITEIFPKDGQYANTGCGTILKIVTKRYSSGTATFMRKCTITGKSPSGVAWETWAYGNFSKSIPHPEIKRLTANTCKAAHMAVLADSTGIAGALREAFGG